MKSVRRETRNKDADSNCAKARHRFAPMYEDDIAWCDEIHKECFSGDFREGSTTQVRFPRDADRKYNPKGEYREKT